MNIAGEIGTIQNIMREVLTGLDNINSDNFEDNFHLIIEKAEKAQKMRSSLKIKYPEEILKNNEKELLFLAKQIKNSYDNLIKKNREESETVAVELKNLMNSKKIANYNR